MAEPSGGQTYHAQDGVLERMFSQIDVLVPTTWATCRVPRRSPPFRWVVAPALGLLAAGLPLSQTLLRRGPR